MIGGDVLIVLVVVLVIVLVWRGPKTLPKLGGALGKSIRDFRHEMNPDEADPPETPKEP
jgi:TatA/E family protein of Tat protein translocase